MQNDLNAIPIKRQTLEIENLNQDLVIKKLQTKRLEQKLKLNSSFIYLPREQSAKERIQNHLSYKLGKVMVENSKNVLDCVSLPFILLCIVFLHRKEQRKYKIKIKQNPKLSLPFLETYPDYYQALREKECFTYKLGEAFIKASKNWYKGGYLIFILRDVPRLNMELKQKNRN
ncbi:hypothetical protein [Campylobacter jejuni]|uniref:hypothetical protein n=1 Tax=Campylobacter jejuni TaxID=197 RepID=UPI000E21B858|nr:hypothetical protein [Campylobacter jejuni]